MKTISRIFIPVCCAVALVSCSKEAFQENKDTEEGQQLITAYVNAGGPSKLAYEEVVEGGGAGVSSVWQDGDHFLAIQDGAKTVEFRLVSGAGTAQGVFQTLTSGVTSTTQWVGVVGNGAEAHNSEIHCGYMKQDGTIKSLSGFNYVKVTATGEEPYFNFAEGEGLSYVMRIKLPAGIKCIEYTPCAWYKITASGKSIVYFNNNNQNDYSAKNTSFITLSKSSAKGDLIYIAVPTVNFSYSLDDFYSGSNQYANQKTGVVLTIMNDNSDDATLSTGTVVREDYREKGGLIGTIDLSEEPLLNRPKPSEAICITHSGDINFVKEYVSSSYMYQRAHSLTTYFAPYNIGATVSSDAGNFYAYGECAPKSQYNFTNYLYRHNRNGQHYDGIAIEYKPETSRFYTTSQSRYDMARVLWGCAWRLPFWIEFKGHESLSSVVNLNSVKGIQFTQNTNTIFLPMLDWKCSDSDSQSGGTKYCCWTSDKTQMKYSDDSNHYKNVFVLGCLSAKTSVGSNVVVDYYNAQMKVGLPVRAVLASSEVEWY